MRLRIATVCLLMFSISMVTTGYSQRGGGSSVKTTKLEEFERKRDAYVASLKEMEPGKDDEQIAKLKEYIADVEAKIATLKPDVRVFPLRHVTASDCVVVIEALFSGDDEDVRLGVDERSNQLIVSAPIGRQETIATLLEQIDVPTENARQIGETASGSVVVDDRMAELVMDYLKSRDVTRARATVSGGKATIVFEADSQKALDQIEKEIFDLEQKNKPQSRSIRVVWLTDDVEKKKVPDDMKPVVVELEKMGMAGMAVKSQLAVRTLGRFTSASRHGEYELSAKGEFSSGLLDIKLDVNRHFVSSDKPRVDAVINLSTQIEATIGHPIVLGVSPSKAGHSAFVVVIEQ